MEIKFLKTNKTYAVIDIGSNSVRLMVSNGEKTIYKINEITKLAKGQGEDGALETQAIERTALAVFNYYKKATNEGVEKIYAFATASVRKAPNKSQFINRVKELCGLEVKVVSGEEEALLGANGSLGDNDGVVIDVGGASTEITVKSKTQIIYSKSVNVGAVFLNEKFGQNQSLIENYLSEVIKEFGEVPKTSTKNVVGVGGTATTVSAMLLQLEKYDPLKVDGFKVEKNQLISLKNSLFKMTLEEKKQIKGLQAGRAEVIAGGLAILCAVLEYIKQNSITSSEKDNLEGYLAKMLKNNGEQL